MYQFGRSIALPAGGRGQLPPAITVKLVNLHYSITAITVNHYSKVSGTVFGALYLGNKSYL